MKTTSIIPPSTGKKIGYHIKEIEKGIHGEFSKVTEEYMELRDARYQDSKIMQIMELSDLVGAIDAYVMKISNNSIDIKDLIVMTEATNRAFCSGERLSRD